MLRLSVLCAVLLAPCFTSHLPAQTPKTAAPSLWYLRANSLEVGQAGLTEQLYPEVFQVLGDKEMLVFAEGIGERGLVHVKGVPTKGLVDGKRFALPTVMKVTGTHRYVTVAGGTKTVFTLEPETDAERAKREAGAKALADAAARAKRQKVEEDERRAREAAQAAADKKTAEEARRKAEAPAKAEKAARASLELTKELIKQGRTDLVLTRLERLIKEYPDTEAAKEARKLLKGR